MREIKFRAWDKEQKQMLTITGLIDTRPKFGDSVYNAENEQGFRRSYAIPNYKSEPEEWGHPDDLIWMQYTGMKDKNGKEIFEGDVLNIYQYGHVVAEFAEGCYGAWDHYGFSPFRGTLFGCGGEVIGNIYENPELMA